MESYVFLVIPESHEKLLVIASGHGIRRVAFSPEDFETVLKSYPDAAHKLTGLLEDATGQIELYLRGKLQHFSLPLDLESKGEFQRKVMEHLALIPYGKTQSYSSLAEGLGTPKATRAAGSACKANPVPLIVPCHRVVRNDGTSGQYLGGTKFKEILLKMEKLNT